MLIVHKSGEDPERMKGQIFNFIYLFIFVIQRGVLRKLGGRQNWDNEEAILSQGA